jgi:hypothetical protein
MSETNPATRILIILLVAAGILETAVCIAAHSLGRRRGEANVALVQNQADADRKDAADHLASAQRENGDLVKQLELAKANFDEQAKKLAAIEKETESLRHDLDDATKKIADLTEKQKNADARIKQAEDAAAEAREKEHKAQLALNSLKRERAATRAEALKADVTRAVDANRGQNNRHHGSVASLPRTSPSFSDLDTDHDGRLTLKEYKSGFPSEKNAEEEFKTLDTNGDGYLSISEYKVGHPDPPVVSIKRQKKN